jgi:hypothetical protein
MFETPRHIELKFQRAIEKLLSSRLDIPPGSTTGEILQRTSDVIQNETASEKLGMLFSRRMVAEVRVPVELARITG